MTAFNTYEQDQLMMIEQQYETASPTFDKLLQSFYKFDGQPTAPVGTEVEPAEFSDLTPKRGKGRPPKVKPTPPAGITKNYISDEDVEAVDFHDQHLLRMEYRQLTVEDNIPETQAIEELAALYGLSYRAVFSVVG